MYKYHNLVHNYSVQYQSTPQLTPLPAMPYLKDVFTTLIENSIRQSIVMPAVSFSDELMSASDYTVFVPDASGAVLPTSAAGSYPKNDGYVMGLSA